MEAEWLCKDVSPGSASFSLNIAFLDLIPLATRSIHCRQTFDFFSTLSSDGLMLISVNSLPLLRCEKSARAACSPGRSEPFATRSIDQEHTLDGGCCQMLRTHRQIDSFGCSHPEKWDPRSECRSLVEDSFCSRRAPEFCYFSQSSRSLLLSFNPRYLRSRDLNVTLCFHTSELQTPSKKSPPHCSR